MVDIYLCEISSLLFYLYSTYLQSRIYSSLYDNLTSRISTYPYYKTVESDMDLYYRPRSTAVRCIITLAVGLIRVDNNVHVPKYWTYLW
jgi:hypothetical protein